MIALVWAGCSGTPSIVEPVSLRAFEDVPLARLLSVATEAPHQLSVRATAEDQGFEVTWPQAREAHEVPLLGLKPGRTWEIEVWLDGRRVDTQTVDTDPMPPDFAVIDVLAHEPDLLEPGYRLATVRRVTETGRHFLVAFDVEDLEVAWYTTTPAVFGDVRRTSRGTLIGLRPTPEETDLLMRTLRRWTPEPALPNDVPLPVAGAHHELYPLSDGSMLTLSRQAHTSEAYPSSLEAPEVRDQSAVLMSSQVVRFDRDGALLASHPLADVLDDGRISMSSLDRDDNDFGYDWLHANAVIPTPDGGTVVSVRHQDAIVKLDGQGELVWILGDPSGWSPELVPYLLEAQGELEWPYHPHAPAFDADGALVLFDNHNFGHTPYTEPPEEPWSSRVVAYEIDEQAMTVRQAWSWRPTGPGLQSPRMGDADPLPHTGNILANFGWIEEGPVGTDGRPQSVWMRLVELDPASGEAWLDLGLRSPDDGGPPGVRSYRSESIPSLYADDVLFRRF